MIKKWGIYFILILAGLLLGYLFFGLNKTSKSSNDDVAIEVESGRWTCAMHPNVDGKEHETCPLCAMDLVWHTNNSKALTTNQIKMSADAAALANIQTTLVGATDAEGISLYLSGTVTTNKKTDAIQTILFDGRVDALYPNYVGKRVRSGQEIGKVYSPELYLAQDKLLTSLSYKESHQSLYETARNTLGMWKMTDNQIDEMIAYGKPMVNFPLYADVTGTVTEVLATEGNFYKQGDPLYKVSDLSWVWVVLDAYEEQLQLLKVGQEVALQFSALPNEVKIAKVSFVEPVLQKDKRTVAVRVLVQNDKGKLKPGMFAEAQIKAVSEQKNILSIPKSAVLWTGKRSIVYKKSHPENSVFELVEVELGQSFTTSYEVLSGLSINDQIVTHGAFTIDASAQLMGKNSMMNRANTEDFSSHSEQLSTAETSALTPLAIDMSTGQEQILQAYFELKDALVASDFKVAHQQTIQLNKILEVALKNKTVNTTSYGKVHKKLQALNNASNMATLRKEFKLFSLDMISTTRASKNLPKTVYVQFCPMADDGKGANWLSLTKEIENPYFGESMLRCGVIKEEFN